MLKQRSRTLNMLILRIAPFSVSTFVPYEIPKSFGLEFSPGITHKSFVIFGMKLGCHLTCRVFGPKGPKIGSK